MFLDPEFKFNWLETTKSSIDLIDKFKSKILDLIREEWEMIFNETKEVISNQAFSVLTEVIESPDCSQIPASESFSNMELMDFWRIAIKYLSLPASSGLVERLFSRAGYISRLHRSSLTVENLEIATLFRYSSKKSEKIKLNKRKKRSFYPKKLIISIAVGLSILTPSSIIYFLFI
ncbi:hypothetical protein BpHYR1_025814 [Brachionus plicatilis]|uniref:HAT C-terminal dimerisation domain-containing protein n=1 Tax=Brachionus plicatilis TaxID=10195 RepID=A0A3M7PDJ0_BRAPC|nr:hypothetical protein BpHYR1_025814 [Brachionus plicatilis]